MRNLSIYKTQIERISKKLKELKAIDKKLNIFGAKCHKYKLSRTIRLDKLKKIEEKYGVYLPDEYVAFITFLGNGVVGPNYGISSIENLLQPIYDEIEDGIFIDITKPSYFSSKEKLKDFREINKKIEDDDERDNHSYKILNGTIRISLGGCSISYYMIINGFNTGKILVVNEDCIECGFYDSNYDRLIGFLDWYEEWLDTSIEFCQNYK